MRRFTRASLILCLVGILTACGNSTTEVPDDDPGDNPSDTIAARWDSARWDSVTWQ